MTADRCSGAEPGARIVAAARGWLGTPYRHRASLKGVGADCLGLVRGVWRETLGAEPETAPPYAPDWAEAGMRETLLDAAARHLRPVATETARAGDVLVFRLRRDAVAKHCAILVAGPLGAPGARMIHAYSGHAVCETAPGPGWRRRLAGAFRFPTEDR